MDKQHALTLANSDVVNSVARARQAGNLPESEVVRFEQMCNAIIVKGESLPDSFFSALKSGATGRDIFRAIHGA